MVTIGAKAFKLPIIMKDTATTATKMAAIYGSWFGPRCDKKIKVPLSLLVDMKVTANFLKLGGRGFALCTNHCAPP